ncbi:hypothetical protein [Beggiatoa alba]|uniref:hypothetical protein n=1 Tax=Beggiatoa alba TaxID=1022 RepID=UPI00058AC587|nr:hypothetical protein [Beggiatoa alba]
MRLFVLLCFLMVSPLVSSAQCNSVLLELPLAQGADLWFTFGLFWTITVSIGLISWQGGVFLRFLMRGLFR